MTPLDLGAVLRAAQAADPASIPDIVEAAARSLVATDVVVYLVDFGQQTLEPLPGRSAPAEAPQSEPVSTSMAGRAFVGQEVISSERPGGTRVWAPVVEGSDRTGVLALTVERPTAEVLGACEELGLLTGYLVLKTERVTVAGVLEPAYEVGGDCFDYALNHAVLDLGVFDAMGHGVQAAQVASLAVGSYRHGRRDGRALGAMHADLDATLAEQYGGSAFATGLLVRVDLDTGTATWTNAGHPPPILLRGGAAVGELRCPPTVPWGLGRATGLVEVPEVATERLEPGDRLVLYTDGVVEAHRLGGEQFGVERLVDLVGQHSSEDEGAEEVVRRLVRSVLDRQGEELADDATVVMVQWDG